VVVSLPRHCGLLWISLAGSVGVGLFALGRRLRCLRGNTDCEATVTPAVRVYVCCVNVGSSCRVLESLPSAEGMRHSSARSVAVPPPPSFGLPCAVTCGHLLHTRTARPEPCASSPVFLQGTSSRLRQQLFYRVLQV